MVDRTPLEPPPIVVVVMGPPKVGKSTLIRCLIRNFTRQKLSEIRGPVTIVSGRECLHRLLCQGIAVWSNRIYNTDVVTSDYHMVAFTDLPVTQKVTSQTYNADVHLLSLTAWSALPSVLRGKA